MRDEISNNNWWKVAFLPDGPLILLEGRAAHNSQVRRTGSDGRVSLKVPPAPPAEPQKTVNSSLNDRDVNETLRSETETRRDIRFFVRDETETRPSHIFTRPRRDRDVYFSGPRRDQDRDLASRGPRRCSRPFGTLQTVQ